jgi:hypothetical protein
MSSPPPDSPSILPQPALDARWVHAGAQHLDLLATPVTAQSTTYLAFSAEESDDIDHAWWSRYDDKQRQAIRKQFGATEKDTKDPKAAKEKDEKRSSKDLSNGKQVYEEADEDLSLERDKHGRTAEEREKAKDDVIRSGEEQPREDNEEAKIREEMESNEDLETIKGIPVSQVGRAATTLTSRTACSKSPLTIFRFIQSSGHTLGRAFLFCEGRGSLVTSSILVIGSWRMNWSVLICASHSADCADKKGDQTVAAILQTRAGDSYSSWFCCRGETQVQSTCSVRSRPGHHL